jgi:hypothetical protein
LYQHQAEDAMNKKILIYVIITASIIVAIAIWLLTPNLVNSKQNGPLTLATNPITIDIKKAPSETEKSTSALQIGIDQFKSAFPFSDPAWAWARVDMDAVRDQMPNNLYWELASPTNDPLVLDQRKDHKEFWEKEYGKVLSGTAAESEVRAYYAHRLQVSTDYLEFSNHLLTNYANKLPERDANLLNLTRNLHGARLREIPNELNQAIERSQAHAARREAWLEDKEAFEAELEAQAKQ